MERVNALFDSTVDLTIAAALNSGSSSQHLEGRIADVRVYRGVLSASEIDNLSKRPPSSNSAIQLRSHNRLNQATQLEDATVDDPSTPSGDTTLSYHANGNITDDGVDDARPAGKSLS